MDLGLEKRLRGKHPGHLIIGLDEVGRGALAGPVVACAFCFGAKKKLSPEIKLLKDSKKLTPKKREEFLKIFKKNNFKFAISFSKVETINKKGINEAIFLAMGRAVRRLLEIKNYLEEKTVILIDGRQNLYPKLKKAKQLARVKGDSKIISIAAASVAAKVFRDKAMARLHQFFPQYNFLKHKGYGTQEHIKAIRKYKPSVLHRRDFIRKIV